MGVTWRIIVRARGLGEERLAEGDNTLLDTRAGTLDHDKVFVDNTIVGEATHGGDGLLGQVKLSRTVVGSSETNTVDLLVDLGTVVVAVLTSARHRVLDGSRVPGTNASNLAETLVSLARKTGDSPTGGDTFESLTLGDGKSIDHLVLLKDRGDGELLLEEVSGELDLLGNSSTVDLDLHNVSLLLTKVDLADLGVCNDTDDAAVAGNALEVTLNRLLTLGIGILLGVVGEGLLLGAVPVLWR